MAEPKKLSKLGSIDVQGMLRQDGMEFVGKDESGAIQVRDTNTGSVGAIKDLKGYVKDFLSENEPETLKKYSLDQFDISVNSAEDAVDSSPVGFIDRLKLSFGNDKGKIKSLKSKYDDATLNSKGELVVKDSGVWHKVDPTEAGYDNPWEFANDAIDLAGDAVVIGSSIVGGVVGSPAVGGTVGAAVGEGIRTSLGRIVGTYDSTPQEQLRDAGVEALWALGGYGVGKVAEKAGKLAYEAISSSPNIIGAAKGIGWVKNAPVEVKDIMAKVVGFTSGKGATAAANLIDHSDDAIKLIAQNTRKGLSYDEVLDNFARENINEMGEVLKSFKPAVVAQYKKEKSEFLTSKGLDQFKLEIGDLKKLFVEGGTVNNSVMDGMALDPVLGKLFKPVEKGGFELIEKKALKDITWPDPKLAFHADKLHSNVGKFLDKISKVDTSKPLTKQSGALQALNIKDALDDLYFESTAITKEFKQVIGPRTAALRTAIHESLGQTPAGKMYERAMATWSQNVDQMAYAEKLIRSKDVNSMGKVVQSLTDRKAGTESSLGLADRIKEIAKKGDKQINLKNIMAKNAAKDFIELAPSIHNLAGGPGLAIGAAGGAAFMSDSPEAGLIGGGALLTLTSPRLMAKGVNRLMKSGDAVRSISQIPVDAAQKLLPVAHKIKDFIGKASMAEKKAMRSDPEILARIVAPLFTTLEDQEDLKNMFLNNAINK